MKTIKKLLIANRGEIACRIIKTAHKLGIKTVAIYSSADEHALHVKLADEAFCVGPAPSRDSYLKSQKIIDIAVNNAVDAIHPGYGFLSENAAFAELCLASDIIFVGPPASAIVAMGSKSAAKTIMEEAGVPLVPGYHGDVQDPAFLKQQSIDMGFPVLLKAAAGGGGKGMREVHHESEFDEALNAAKRESMASFNDEIMLVEKFLMQPRHVEIQVFCDNHGNGVYLFERDCSIQRRHQKVIEEAPAPNLSQEIRQQMGESALRAAHAINYSGAGTVEFLYDVDGSFYFMEMNTRLQVEHPVTEMITGEDLVEWQLIVASNRTLPKTQAELCLNGHAIEARIYAEDPQNEFLPSTGVLSLLQTPPQNETVRVDTGVLQGDEVSIYYDPMIAKLIVWGNTRQEAIAKLNKSLEQYSIGGVSSNINYLQKIAKSRAFNEADLCTQFITKNENEISTDAPAFQESSLALTALVHLLSRVAVSYESNSSWDTSDSFRLNTTLTETLVFVAGEQRYSLEVMQLSQYSWCVTNTAAPDNKIIVKGKLDNTRLSATIDDYQLRINVWIDKQKIYLYLPNGLQVARFVSPDLGINEDDSGHGGVEAPMNGTVVDLLVAKGDEVKKGQTLIIVEAMKMEHAVKAPFDATVNECFFDKGDLVDGGTALIDLTQHDAKDLA